MKALQFLKRCESLLSQLQWLPDDSSYLDRCPVCGGFQACDSKSSTGHLRECKLALLLKELRKFLSIKEKVRYSFDRNVQS